MSIERPNKAMTILDLPKIIPSKVYFYLDRWSKMKKLDRFVKVRPMHERMLTVVNWITVLVITGRESVIPIQK